MGATCSPVSAGIVSSIDDRVCHEVIDDAGLVALCGADISAHPWCDCDQVTGHCRLRQECVVCADLGRSYDDVRKAIG